MNEEALWGIFLLRHRRVSDLPETAELESDGTEI